jgi:HSP20 family protein
MTVFISPYRRMASLREAMNRMFEDSLAETPTPEREMLLAVDVLAEDEAYTITALVPGLDADDLSVEMINNTITLRGEFKSSAREDAKFLVSELPTGRFSRVITLPTALDLAKADASIKNGVLVLRIPKAEAHRPRTIKVSKG